MAFRPLFAVWLMDGPFYLCGLHQSFHDTKAALTIKILFSECFCEITCGIGSV
jgi:hypothetical protein